MARDLTSYPEGFKNLCKELKLGGKTFDSEEAKEAYVWSFIDLVVRW